MMAAARGLLGQVYLVTSTNFDFSLLAPFMSYSWVSLSNKCPSFDAPNRIDEP